MHHGQIVVSVMDRASHLMTPDLAKKLLAVGSQLEHHDQFARHGLYDYMGQNRLYTNYTSLSILCSHPRPIPNCRSRASPPYVQLRGSTHPNFRLFIPHPHPRHLFLLPFESSPWYCIPFRIVDTAKHHSIRKEGHDNPDQTTENDIVCVMMVSKHEGTCEICGHENW